MYGTLKNRVSTPCSLAERRWYPTGAAHTHTPTSVVEADPFANGFFDSKADPSRVSTAEFRKTLPNFASCERSSPLLLSYTTSQAVCLILRFSSFPHRLFFLSGDTSSAGKRNSEIDLWDLLDPGKQDLFYQSDLLLRGYHTTNETMPTSVPKTSALGVCKQCQTNDAVENVRSRPMCR